MTDINRLIFEKESKYFYHGTSNYGFNDFNKHDVNYFTDNYNYALKYTNSSFSALRFNKQNTIKAVYTVKLKCKNIFDTKNNATDKRIFDFYTNKFGNGTPLCESGYPDWSDVENLAEFFEERKYNYDCIILQDAFGVISYATIGKNKAEIIDKKIINDNNKNFINENKKSKFCPSLSEYLNESSNKDYLSWKRKNVTLRGITDIYNTDNDGMSKYGQGLYSVPLSNKSMVKEYGKLYFLVNAIPKNPKTVFSVNDAEIFLQQLVTNYCKKNNHKRDNYYFSNYTSIAKEMLELGYDGLVIKGREIVNYKPENILYFENEYQLEDYYNRSNKINENASKKETIVNFVKNEKLLTKDTIIKTFLYHGTNKNPKDFKLIDDYDGSEGNIYMSDIPEGYVFLTSDYDEAKCYGQYVIPCEVKVDKIKRFTFDTDRPSIIFDDDFCGYTNYSMFTKFCNSDCDILEIKGNRKSTYLTYPELILPRTDLAIKFYKLEDTLTESNNLDYSSWKRKNVTLRGIVDENNSINKNGSMLGKGLYTTQLSNKSFAKEYGIVKFVVNAIPKNPKTFNTLNDFEIWFQNNLVFKYSKENGKNFPDIRDFNLVTTLEDEMLKFGYDGIIIKGREMVNYKPENILYFNDELQLKNYYTIVSNKINESNNITGDDLILKKDTVIFHGTCEDFDIKNTSVGGYDSLFWCAYNSPIAQTYIPESFSTVFTSTKLLFDPRRGDKNIQEQFGIFYEDVDKNSYKEASVFADISDKHSKAWGELYEVIKKLDVYKTHKDNHTDNMSDEESDLYFKEWSNLEDLEIKLKKEYDSYDIDKFKANYINDKLKELGYEPTNGNSPFYDWELKLDGNNVARYDFKLTGRLLIIKPKKDLKIFDITENGTKEGDLTDLDYHKHDWFKYAKDKGYDGIRINDFAQSVDHGNVNHLSIGLFKETIKYLDIVEIPAIHRELKTFFNNDKWITPEYDNYLKNGLNITNEGYDNALLKKLDYKQSRNHADKYGIKLFQKWFDSLQHNEKEIIEWYRDSGSREISNILNNTNNRRDYDLLDDIVLDKINKLNNILNKSKVKKDVVVYKGITKGLLYDKIKNSDINSEIHFKNFISTTLHFQYSVFGFTDDLDKIILKINLPKNTSCAFVSFDLAESEIIINKDTTLKIVNIEKKKIFDRDVEYTMYTCDIVD